MNKGVFVYTTFDGHVMKEGEIMWRVCNSTGVHFTAPLMVRFKHNTGYNMENIPVGVKVWKAIFDLSKNPYHPGQIHFFSPEKANEYLSTHKKLPTIEELNHYISIYKPDYCPCILGKPFYPDNNCQCGG